MRVYAQSMLSRTDDATLVRRMQAGEERAFEAIFKRHHAPLLSYCRHMLGNQAEGEDALQQAFIKAHQALLVGNAPRELRPWLYAIARNCCLTAIAARRTTVALQDDTPALAGLTEEVHRREDLRELVAGIGRLPEDQRSALLLAELDDLDHRAIATVVGCEVSKVKALIYQARSALIADRDARETPCEDIREQLAVARGGELRRGPLRRHLKLCVGCRDFQLAVNAQRHSLGVVLPVLPSAGLAAAILGHGAAHVAGAASVGGVGAGGASVGAAGAGGASVGAAGAGGTGIAASGTAASTAAGAGAGAGAGGGTGIGALAGGGLVTKLAVGGAVVVLASAGVVTVHNREAHTSTHRAVETRLASADMAAEGYRAASYIADPGAGLSGSVDPESPVLTPANGAAPAGSPAPGTGPAGWGSLTELTDLGGVAPLPSASGTPAQGTSAPSTTAAGTAAAAHHRQLRRARLRRRRLAARHLAARRRTRLRKALKRRQIQVKHANPKHTKKPKPPAVPVVTVPPARTPHRKAHPPRPTPTTTPTSTPTPTSAPGETGSTETTSTGAKPKPHPKKPGEEAKREEKGKEKEKEQPPNPKAERKVTGVDVQPTPTETKTEPETGGTRNAS